MYCNFCGAEVPATSKFCQQCGARLKTNDIREETPGTSVIPPAQSPDSNKSQQITCYLDECLLQEPKAESAVIAELHKGDLLTIIKKEEEYFYSKLETGEQKGLVGYIGMWAVVPPETDEGKLPEPASSVTLPNPTSKEERDEILGVFSLLQESGRGILTREDPRILIFTTSRLIIAKQGLFDRASLRIFGGATVYKRFNASARDRLKWEQISADDYLKADPENIEMPYREINALELERGRLLVFGKDLDAPCHRFRLARSSSNIERLTKDFEAFLHTVLPDKV